MTRAALRLFGLGFAMSFAIGVSAWGQSLDSHAPTPLSPGENRGQLDNQVGPQFWSFHYRPGHAQLSFHFTSMGLFGNPTPATMEIVLHGPGGVVWNTHPLTSNGQMATLDFPADFKTAGSGSIELRPAGSNIVRNGGDYSITFSGSAADFAGGGEAASAQGGRDPIVGTYAVMVCPPDFDCTGSLAIRFAADGSAVTNDGHSGRWSAFDPDSHIYSVVIGPDRWSLKLVPGRGLFNTNDLSVVVFQAVRPR